MSRSGRKNAQHFPSSLNSLVIHEKTPPSSDGGRRVRLVDGVGRGRTAPIPPSSRQTSTEEYNSFCKVELSGIDVLILLILSPVSICLLVYPGYLR